MLYKEASRILQCIQEKKGSLKTLVLSSNFRNKKQLYAIVCETLKYKPILTTILEKTKLQRHEKILKQEHLVLVLLYDFLLGKGFTGRTDKFKDAVLKHKAALQSELARLKVKAGATTNEDLLPNKLKQEATLPRYMRVNTLKRPIQDVVDHFRKEQFTQIHSSKSSYESYMGMVRSLKNKQFLRDPYIPQLLVFASGTDLHDHVLYTTGEIIFQDKASCIPALVLAPPPGSHVIDCCAAPGNKTSHLAAIMQNKGKLYAFDKDMKRATTLSTMLLRAGVLCASCKNMDFLKCDPGDPEYKDVEYILVDPSCSGSGITNRLNDVTDDEESSSEERLAKLSKFQLTILTHAMSFPRVKKLVYSTCSIHQIENESVVNEALRLTMNQFKLVSVMREFPNRGQKISGACDRFKAKKCLRLNPGSDLSNGFFVALFERIESAVENATKIIKQEHIEEPSAFVTETTGARKTKKESGDDDSQQNVNVLCSDELKVPKIEKQHLKRRKMTGPADHKVTITGEKRQKKSKIETVSTNIQQPKQGKNKKKNRNRKHKPVTA